MDIVCSIDDNYVQHCCVMLTSFFSNNVGNEHTVHLFSEQLSSESISIIERVVGFYQGRFCYYQVDSALLKFCPINETDHLTIATYYRLFISEFLPAHLEKVLYLDCDIVVNKSLRAFWQLDLSNYAVAAVEEMGCSLPDVFDRLGYDRKYGYFNAGVLLINLLYWRENKATKLFLDYIAKNSCKIVAHDQDVLNALFHDRYYRASYEWNVEEAFYHYSFMKKLGFERSLLQKLCNPAILHYTWKPKPWDDACLHPLRVNYFVYLSKVPFGKHRFRRSFKSMIDKYCFYLLTFLNIRCKGCYKLK